MRRLILLLLATAIGGIITAQPSQQMPQGTQQNPTGEKPDRSAKKLEMLRQGLGMTEKEIAEFAPIYQEYTREVSAVNKEMRSAIQSYDGQEMTEKVAMKIAMIQLQSEADIVNIKKAYIKVFKNYLTPDQLAKIFMVDKRISLDAVPRRGHGTKRPAQSQNDNDELRPKMPSHEVIPASQNLAPAGEDFQQE